VASKKKKPTKLTVLHGGKSDAPWSSTAEGTLRRALDEHQRRPFRELIIVGTRSDERGQLHGPEIWSYLGDQLRGIALLKLAADLLAARIRR